MREAVFLSTYFTVYEHGHRGVLAALGLPAAVSVPVAGGLSGVLAWYAIAQVSLGVFFFCCQR